MPDKLIDIAQFPERIKKAGNFWKYLTPEFDNYLQDYLLAFEDYRNQINIIPPSEEDWKLLPFGSFANDSSWKWRRESLAIISKLIGNKHFGCTLEIGSWNGWLTKTLAQHADVVIANDYFVRPFDGIGNITLLAQNIIPVQCNVDTIQSDFKPGSFDLIVLNHNLSYMNNPAEYIKGLMPLLQPDGIIISLGNTFFKNPQQKIKTNENFRQSFRDQYNRDLYIQPVKGFLDESDKKLLTDSKFKVLPYPNKSIQNLYSFLNPKAPYYCYLIYKNNPNN